MSDFDLKTALKAISARQDKTEQEKLNAEGRSRLDPDSSQNRIARAAQQEAALLEQAEWLQQQPDSELKTQRLDAMLDRLGELAAEQGEYAHAAAVSKSPERRQHYQNIVDAIERPNSDECDCPPELLIDRKAGVEFQQNTMVLADKIVSPDGGSLNLDRCFRCSFLNAR